MIEYIKIEGFKSIKKMEMGLAPINILIGSNGSGKSNFISFFKLIKAIFSESLQKYIIQEKADNILYFGRKQTKTMAGELVFSREEGIFNAYKFQLAQNKEGGLFIENEGVNVGNDYRDTFNWVYNSSIHESRYTGRKQDVTNRFLKGSISMLQVFHFHDTSATSFLRRECDVEDNAALKQDGRNLPAILYLMQQNHPKIFNRIEKTVQSVAPYISRFILEPRRLVGQEDEIALRWVDSGDPESSFSAYQLSDGTLRFIALATLLMQPEPPSIIIIDEPELGLHPFAIGKLAGMIQAASNKTQIIIATQSSGLISHFSPESIIVVDKSETENQTVFKRLNADSLRLWLQDYTLGDLWERNIINAAQPFTQQ